jgi:hypothetical protein
MVRDLEFLQVLSNLRQRSRLFRWRMAKSNVAVLRVANERHDHHEHMQLRTSPVTIYLQHHNTRSAPMHL